MREALNGNPQPGIRGKIIDDADAAMETRGGDPRVLHVAWLHEYQGALLLWVRVFDVLAVAFVVSDSPKSYYSASSKGRFATHRSRQCLEGRRAARTGGCGVP
jgi:hypothetical protein